MDVDLARDMIRTAFHSSSELQNFLEILKRRCSPEEYRIIRGESRQRSMRSGFNKALAAHPELNAEVEASIARHGRNR
jgi:hypothetical protein